VNLEIRFERQSTGPGSSFMSNFAVLADATTPPLPKPLAPALAIIGSVSALAVRRARRQSCVP
jgi:hypothetical protein